MNAGENLYHEIDWPIISRMISISTYFITYSFDFIPKRIDKRRTSEKKMFQVNSTSECQTSEQRLPIDSKKANKKSKVRNFANLTSLIQSWQPSDSFALRRLLVNELQTLLEEKEYNCVRSCIPAIIADKQFPIDMLHYQSEKNIDEFITRMLWMRQEFNSAIGIFLGIPDEETSAKVEEAFESVLTADEDCIILLM